MKQTLIPVGSLNDYSVYKTALPPPGRESEETAIIGCIVEFYFNSKDNDFLALIDFPETHRTISWVLCTWSLKQGGKEGEKWCNQREKQHMPMCCI